MRLEHLHVDTAEQLRRVGRDRRQRLLIDPAGEVQEVKVELDGALNLVGVHVPILPVERGDGGTVAPVVAVLVVPGEFLAGTRIVGIRLFREWPSGLPAIQLAWLGAQTDVAETRPAGFHVVGMKVEGGGLADLDFNPALLDEVVERRIDDVPELGNVGLVDGHAGGEPRCAGRGLTIGIEAVVDDIGLGLRGAGHRQCRQYAGQDTGVLVVVHAVLRIRSCSGRSVAVHPGFWPCPAGRRGSDPTAHSRSSPG